MTNNEIKRCRHCRTEATASLITNGYEEFWRVVCGRECSFTKGYATRQEAIDDWNKRQGETE